MNRSVSRAALTLAVALLAGACASGSASTGTAASPATAGGNGSGTMAANASSSALPAGVTPTMVALGDSLFNNGGCQRCHGKMGAGAVNAPGFKGIKWQHGSGSYTDIVKTITEGVPLTAIKDPTRKFAMRARGGPMALSDDQIKAVAGYVYTISR